MKTREQNGNDKQTEIERFDWCIERTDKRLAFDWLSERLDVILQHDWPVEQCLLHIRVFFDGKTKSLVLIFSAIG